MNIEDISIFADGLDHPECVATHPDGSIWAGGEAGQIYRISGDGKIIEEICNTGGFILGIAFSPNLEWLAICDLKNKCVWKLFLKTLELIKFATGADGEYFNIPNYAVFDKEGRLYVSESGAFRQITGKIFRFEENGEGQIWHHGPFNFANGMALSAAQDFLYVVCTWLPGVERIAINTDGTPGLREEFVNIPNTCPDGIAFDVEENLYITCYAPSRIYKVGKNSNLEILVDDWEAHTISNPTNIAFGGHNHQQLFVANLGRWHLSCITMPAKGLRLTL